MQVWIGDLFVVVVVGNLLVVVYLLVSLYVSGIEVGEQCLLIVVVIEYYDCVVLWFFGICIGGDEYGVVSGCQYGCFDVGVEVGVVMCVLVDIVGIVELVGDFGLG